MFEKLKKLDELLDKLIELMLKLGMLAALIKWIIIDLLQ